MLENLSEETQLIIAIIGIAVLCLIVFANNRHNKRKQYQRKNRNFQKNYHEKKRENKTHSP